MTIESGKAYQRRSDTFIPVEIKIDMLGDIVFVGDRGEKVGARVFLDDYEETTPEDEKPKMPEKCGDCPARDVCGILGRVRNSHGCHSALWTHYIIKGEK